MGTTSAVVTTTFADRCPILGHYNDAYADDVSLTVGNPSLTPAQLTVPTSNVGQIDHVQLIYMENKGVGNIIGSPNAPYINSLINSQDYVSNYYALGHPSDPNYFRVMGGSDFGIAYNPVSNVINAPSLMQEMDQKGISWVGYAQGMPFPGATMSQGTYATDALPFLEFNYVFHNTPAYLQTHLLPLTQLSTGLADPNTARDSRGSPPTVPTIWKALSTVPVALPVGLSARSRRTSTTWRPATRSSSKKCKPSKHRQRGIRRRAM